MSTISIKCVCCCCCVASVVPDSVRPHRPQPTRLPRPWDSPGKNTGMGCHFLLQCMEVKSESEVAQSCPTLSDPMDCSLPGSSVHGIFQASVLEWGAIAFSQTLNSWDKSHLVMMYNPWHHRLDAHEFGWTSGVGDGQGGLACCSPWSHRVRHNWATELNWTDHLIWKLSYQESLDLPYPLPCLII